MVLERLETCLLRIIRVYPTPKQMKRNLDTVLLQRRNNYNPLSESCLGLITKQSLFDRLFTEIIKLLISKFIFSKTSRKTRSSRRFENSWPPVMYTARKGGQVIPGREFWRILRCELVGRVAPQWRQLHGRSPGTRSPVPGQTYRGDGQQRRLHTRYTSSASSTATA